MRLCHHEASEVKTAPPARPQGPAGGASAGRQARIARSEDGRWGVQRPIDQPKPEGIQAVSRPNASVTTKRCPMKTLFVLFLAALYLLFFGWN